MKIKNYLKPSLFLFLVLSCCCDTTAFAANPIKLNKKEPSKVLDLENLGTLSIKKNSSDEAEETTQLLIEHSGVIKVIDSFDGLEPDELFAWDLNGDNNPEVIVILKHTETDIVAPCVYTVKKGVFEKIFTREEYETLSSNCGEVFVTSYNSKPALCLKHLMEHHNYAPPEAYRFELYTMGNKGLELAKTEYSEGTHYNILMNRAADCMEKANCQEAANLYKQAASSLTEEIDSSALQTALFYQALALEFCRKYDEAMAIYEKIVTEFTEGDFTDTAQGELEFLFANKEDTRLLDSYFDCHLQILKGDSHKALAQLDLIIKNNPKSKMMDRLLLKKAEILVNENQIEEAISVYKSLKENYPDSGVIEQVDIMLSNLETNSCDPDEL